MSSAPGLITYSDGFIVIDVVIYVVYISIF